MNMLKDGLDKTLIVIVTHNNPVLLENTFESLEKRNAGYDYDVVIVDATSTQPKQLELLDKLSKKPNTTIEVRLDDRVEENYNLAWRAHNNYKYYFFTHDDVYFRSDFWLKEFIDRMKSGYCEDNIKQTHLSHYPIGKVGAGNQFWRSYSSVLGHPVQCLFLKEVVDIIYPGKDPQIFKNTDGDRVLISNECMEATQGFRNVSEFRLLKQEDPEKFQKICQIFDRHLHYQDVGGWPREYYPVGEYWAKFALTGELLSSIDSLVKGYRSVGLRDDGYLEQIHGFDIPMQHDCITHYGSPNFREFIAKQLNCHRDDVKKRFNDKVFVMKMNKIYEQYLKGKQK